MTEREKLITAIERAREQSEEFGLGFIVVKFKETDLILKLLKEQPLWVSVTDKLPDDASDVLVHYDNGTESRIIPVNYYKGCWYDCVFNRSIDDLETGFIRYWMSLPKPPEG